MVKETLAVRTAWDQVLICLLTRAGSVEIRDDNTLFFVENENQDAFEDSDLLRVLFDTLHLPLEDIEDLQATKGQAGFMLPAAVTYIVAYRMKQRMQGKIIGGDEAPKLIDRLHQVIDEYEAKYSNDEFILEEVFYSFQGEGLDIGLMTTFIRVLGCDMTCVGCDTFYGEVTPKTVLTWPNTERKTTKQLLEQVEGFGASTVCFTGGEPTLYYKKQVPLMAMLRARGYWITLQTNGKKLDDLICGLVQSVNLDIKPPSSLQEVRLDRIEYLWPDQQVKVLVGSEEDIEFALKVDEHIQKVNPDVWLILQPYIFGHEHNAKGVTEGLKNLYDLMDKHANRFQSRLRLTLQSHKLVSAR